MASWYRKVDVRMWGDLKFRSLSPHGQFLWFRLLTGPETTAMPGVIPTGKATLAEALGWSSEAITGAFGELLRQRMVVADFDARLIFLPKALRYNPPAAPNVVISWRSTFDALPECSVKAEILRTFGEELERCSDGFRNAFRKAFRMASLIQDQDQDQDQKQDQDQDQKREKGLPLLRLHQPEQRMLLPPAQTSKVKKPRVDVQTVWDHFVATRTLKGRPPAFDEKRSKMIAERLKSYTVDDLKHAVEGHWLREWHIAEGFIGPEYIFRDAKAVDSCIEAYERAREERPPPAPPTEKREEASEESKQILRDAMARLTQRIDDDNARVAEMISQTQTKKH